MRLTWCSQTWVSLCPMIKQQAQRFSFPRSLEMICYSSVLDLKMFHTYTHTQTSGEHKATQGNTRERPEHCRVRRVSGWTQCGSVVSSVLITWGGQSLAVYTVMVCITWKYGVSHRQTHCMPSIKVSGNIVDGTRCCCSCTAGPLVLAQRTSNCVFTLISDSARRLSQLLLFSLWLFLWLLFVLCMSKHISMIVNHVLYSVLHVSPTVYDRHVPAQLASQVRTFREH